MSNQPQIAEPIGPRLLALLDEVRESIEQGDYVRSDRARSTYLRLHAMWMQRATNHIDRLIAGTTGPPVLNECRGAGASRCSSS